MRIIFAEVKMKKAIIFSFCFLFLILTVSLSAFAAAGASDPLPISHGIYLLAEESGMAMAGVGTSPITFDADDFARAMNLSKVASITITETPPITDGELLIGSTVVSAPITVSAENISHMSYTAKSDCKSSYFRFCVGESSYDLRCDLYMLDKSNSAPTLSTAPETCLNVSTHKNITLYGTLPCYDPDGDETMIEIVSYPKYGSVIITDKYAGSYTYLPSENYTGKDSFCYVARDKYGNYSASRTVNLEINKQSTSVVYADMEDSPMYNAALSVTEAGIMSGTQIGGKSYFYPDKTVSREEFVVMAMNSIGITSVADSKETVFSDNGEISEQMRGYIATAYELGYINGSRVGDELCFLPDKAITRAEAAVIICNMIDAATPTVTPVFKDSNEIPSYAVSAVNSLGYMGILTSSDGMISASSALTREQSAHILSLVMQISQ